MKKRLQDKIYLATKQLSCCRLCPRSCGVDRTRGVPGVCNTLDKALVYGYMPHHGEEPPLSGELGSGTIFFSNCNLKCCFCQNEEISIRGEGEPASPEQIAGAMIHLQNQGCHNINLVTPTHVVPFILKAIDLARDQGLDIPLIYNSSGYETRETLSLLDGFIDIYLPDFKFWNPETAKLVCNAPDYPETARRAIRIMQDQVGDLCIDKKGLARSGILVRHLVMPGSLVDTEEILAFLAHEISPHTRINMMSQYHPYGNAREISSLARPVTPAEFRLAVKKAEQYGLKIIR